MLQNEKGAANTNIETNNTNLSIRNSVWEAAESHGGKEGKELGESQRDGKETREEEGKRLCFCPAGIQGGMNSLRKSRPPPSPSDLQRCGGVSAARPQWLVYLIRAMI